MPADACRSWRFGHRQELQIALTTGPGLSINGESPSCANGGTIGFKCQSPEQVLQFHDTAVAHGGISIEDPPGMREGSMGALHLAYVRDPDGNKLCALYRSS